MIIKKNNNNSNKKKKYSKFNRINSEFIDEKPLLRNS